MRWQVLKSATKCNMNRLKGLLQDSKRCLAELRLETRGKPDDVILLASEESCSIFGEVSEDVVSLLGVEAALEHHSVG